MAWAAKTSKAAGQAKCLTIMNMSSCRGIASALLHGACSSRASLRTLPAHIAHRTAQHIFLARKRIEMKLKADVIVAVAVAPGARSSVGRSWRQRFARVAAAKRIKISGWRGGSNIRAQPCIK